MSTQEARQVAFESAHAETVALLTEALDVGCIVVDQLLVLRSWNRWMEVACGRSTTEVVGRPLLDVFPEIADTHAEAAFRRAAAGESVVFAHRFHGFLLPIKPQDNIGGFTHMQQSARVMPLLQHGEPVGAIAFIQDVTERIAREEELYEARQRAEHANEAKSDFLKGMSHEFRTPLNAIIGYAALLDSQIGGPLTDTQREHLNRMLSGATHLINMVEEILTFASVEAQKASVAIEPVNVSAVAADVLGLLENQAAQKGLQMQAELPDRLITLTDPQRLRQILMNIVGNAIKFTESGGIKITGSSNGDEVALAVTDTGPGIPDHYRDRVFEPFVQVATEARARSSGTGLGLPLSRSLAELLGGTLVIEEIGPPGTRFVLRIPNRTG